MAHDLVREIQRSRLFLLRGISFTVDSSESLNRRPPIVLSTITDLQAEIRPVLLLDTPEHRPPDVGRWCWPRYSKLLIGVRNVGNADDVVIRIAEALQSSMVLLGRLPVGFIHSLLWGYRSGAVSNSGADTKTKACLSEDPRKGGKGTV